MILLDTDHISVLRYVGHPRSAALQARLQSITDQPVATTVISLEEQVRGWLAELGRVRDVRKQVTPYTRLAELCQFFSRWRLVPFDLPAAAEFERLRKVRVRIGTEDLKIAAIALAQDALLLTANLRDFRKVPGLRVENWLERQGTP